MTTQAAMIEALRALALQRIEETHVAGNDTRHSRAANLQAVQSLVDGDAHYTWNIHGVERFDFDEVLRSIAEITGCPADPEVKTGGGYISPSATLAGLEEAAARIVETARRGGTFLMGTGHPGSLIDYYLGLDQLIREWGGHILEPAKGVDLPPNLNLDYILGLAVTTDRASLLHSHDYRAMERMLAETGPVDLVIADHGYAGAAINAGVPVVAMMDTNDPALAVAKRIGADVTILPMDDNRPLTSYLPHIETLRALGTLSYPPGDAGRSSR